MAISSGKLFQRLVTPFFANSKRPHVENLTFKEARRLRGPIYEVLLQELYEDGCTYAARHFERLTEKEEFLVMKRLIRDQVRDNEPLLFALFDNIRLAELTSKLNTQKCGLDVTVNLLYKCIELLESYDTKYGWLLTDVYGIVVKICSRIEKGYPGPSRSISRMYYRYGSYLHAKDHDVEKVVFYLEKSKQLSCTENWLIEGDHRKDTEIQRMHEQVCRKLSMILIKYGRQVAQKRPQDAIELAQRAIKIMLEVGLEHNKLLLCQAYLAQAQFLIQNQDFQAGLKLIEQIHSDFKMKDDRDFNELTCELLLQKAIGLEALNVNTEALSKAQEAIVLSKKLNLPFIEAEALVVCAKVLAKTEQDYHKAEITFEKAKKMFIALNAMRNKTKVEYHLAKLRADKMFPKFIKLLKNAETSRCGFNNLRLWKNYYKSFDPDHELDRQKINKFYCVLGASSNGNSDQNEFEEEQEKEHDANPEDTQIQSK